MLYREFISALVMTGIIIGFAIPLTQLSGESQVVPLLLLVCMTVFNVGQYILAALRYRARLDAKLSIKGYPLRCVLALFILTVAYLLTLQEVGFYPGSLIYFILATLIAQPMKLTPSLIAKRAAICFACIAFLYCLFTVLLAVQIPKGFLGI